MKNTETWDWCGESVTPEMREEAQEGPFPGMFELWGGDPTCAHQVRGCSPGGGVKCTKCDAWFCY